MADAMARAAYIRALKSLRGRYYVLHNDEGDLIDVAGVEPLLNNILQAFDQTTAEFKFFEIFVSDIIDSITMVETPLMLEVLSRSYLKLWKVLIK